MLDPKSADDGRASRMTETVIAGAKDGIVEEPLPSYWVNDGTSGAKSTKIIVCQFSSALLSWKAKKFLAVSRRRR